MIEFSAQNFPPGALTPGYTPRLAMGLAPADIATLEQAAKDLRARASGIEWKPGQRAQIVAVRAGDVVITLEVQHGQTLAAEAPTPGPMPEPAPVEIEPVPHAKGKRGA